MKYAKLLNGNIEYYVRPSHILGNCEPDAISKSYKPVIEQEGNGGTYETDTQIIIETSALVVNDWIYPERLFRITVPIGMLFSSPTWIGLWNYTQAMEIPSYKEGDNRIFYLETILPSHEQFLTSQNIIIEHKQI